MSLEAGTRLGSYEIAATIGAGGMGEVYRGRDTTLNRDVAIKVLPAALSNDAERLARFKREAQVLAALNHPNIAHVYGFEVATLPDGSNAHFLAMEMVEGEDLSERLKRGAIPVDEAIAIAKQIAEGLEEAHEHGIIHRDLKPANVMVTSDGKVKVLDFGLAKALEDDPATSGANSHLTHSPTMSRHMTEAGMIMGTAAYMSPEQARGKAVDKRSDIWAFGVVFFEMLTGERLFAGETLSDVLAGVLKTEIDLNLLPAATPFAIQNLIRRCLERSPRSRLHDIADARIAIDDLLAGRGDSAPRVPAAIQAPAGAGRWQRALPWTLAALGALVAIVSVSAGMASKESPESSVVSRLTLPLPVDAPLAVEGWPSQTLALSTDGRQIAYATGHDVPDPRIRLRRLNDSEIRPIPGTEKGAGPFFSPDGRWLAYFDQTEGALKKIAVDGGRAVTLARGFANAGWMLGCWGDDGRIVFDTWNGGLRVIDESGGEVRVLTEPKDQWHLDPQPLPGAGRALFYSVAQGAPRIEAISIDTGERTEVLENASHGRYLSAGFLLFTRDDAQFVAPFDADRLKVTGPATPVPIDVAVDSRNLGSPTPQLAVSRTGTLVYAPSDPGAGGNPVLVSVTLPGQVEEVGPLPFPMPRVGLSPDGTLLAFTGRRAGRAHVEILDLSRRTTAGRFDPGGSDAPTQPVWTPDGKAVLYARNGPFEGEIVRHLVDGAGPDQTLLKVRGTWLCPTSISADGRFLLVTRWVQETGGDVVLIDLESGGSAQEAKPLVTTSGSDFGGVFSPDGRWFAYVSGESGASEILIEKFPERGQKTRVASGPIGLVPPPMWSPDGKEIYFMRGTRGQVDVMAARVEHTPTLRVAEPRRLFTGNFLVGADSGQTFAVSPDGRRFILQRLPPGRSRELGSATQLQVVQNWFTELRTGGAAQ